MSYLFAETDLSLLGELGVAGIFVMLLLRQVFDFIGKQKESKNGGSQKGKIDALFEWHKPDTDGEQIWKNKQMIELLKEIRKENVRSTKALENNNRLIERLLPILQRQEI